MNKRKKTAIGLAICMGLMGGCKSTTTNEIATKQGNTVPVQETTIDKEFTDNDLEAGYTEEGATILTLAQEQTQIEGEGAVAEGNIITISREGTYILRGVLTDGQVRVDATNTEKIRLIMEGAKIHCEHSAPIYIKQADKVFLTLAADTENVLTDGTNYTVEEEDTVDAVIFSKDDLTINGDGTLRIQASYKHGIVSKDNLVITGGMINVQANGGGIDGKDCVKINGGTINLTAVKDGIQSKNEEDTTLGYVYIAGGTIQIDSNEGVEGNWVVIDGGEIQITAKDDALNAANYIQMDGGTVVLSAQADGVDSNGDFYLNGGELYINGPTNSGNSALDYDGQGIITGGTIVAAGPAGMAQGLSESSTQCSVLYNFPQSVKADTEVSVYNEEGIVILTYAPSKDYQSIVISSPTLTQGDTYTIKAGELSEEITLDGIATGSQNSGGKMGDMAPGGEKQTPPTDREFPQEGNPPVGGTIPPTKNTENSGGNSNENLLDSI